MALQLRLRILEWPSPFPAKTLPGAGDEVLQGSEQDVKRALANRERKAEIEASLVDLEAINVQRRLERERKGAEAEAEATGQIVSETRPTDAPGLKELRLVIKGDVSGSVEAVEAALQDIGNAKARVKIVSTGVGEVSESDVLRAKAVEGECDFHVLTSH